MVNGGVRATRWTALLPGREKMIINLIDDLKAIVFFIDNNPSCHVTANTLANLFPYNVFTFSRERVFHTCAQGYHVL